MAQRKSKMESMVKAAGFYKNKKIVVTGHTGFKGSWLTLWLHSLGAQITGIALDPKNEYDAFNAMLAGNLCNDIRFDIKDHEGLKNIFVKAQPEIVFHLAAQPLVLESYHDPLNTLNTNIIGTANILEASRQAASVKVVVVITTDKCYENTGLGKAFSEKERLGGDDPYSASKAAAEIVVNAYRRSFFSVSGIALATARAGNVIGGGDWAEHRLIPDCVRALLTGNNMEIRNPASIRPWQHVLEPLGGYLLLARKMYADPERFSEPWNFGPDYKGNKTVKEVVKEFMKNAGNKGYSERSEKSSRHEAEILSLDISKARKRLGWKPVLSFEDSIKMTAEWYMAQSEGKNMREFSIDQIKYYEKLISGKF
jgi:CDP-glucose 4,6-dehydratase